jgi:hypothetical protein
MLIQCSIFAVNVESSDKYNIQLALQWPLGSSPEKVVTAARIHNVKEKSLQMALKCHNCRRTAVVAYGGHNRVLHD